MNHKSSMFDFVVSTKVRHTNKLDTTDNSDKVVDIVVAFHSLDMTRVSR